MSTKEEKAATKVCKECGGPVAEGFACAWCMTTSPDSPKPDMEKTSFEKIVDATKGITFLPDCKWQHDIRNVTFCSNSDNEQYQKPCSKRCENPELKEQE